MSTLLMRAVVQNDHNGDGTYPNFHHMYFFVDFIFEKYSEIEVVVLAIWPNDGIEYDGGFLLSMFDVWWFFSSHQYIKSVFNDKY